MSTVSRERYSDLIRTGRIAGHDARPDDYDDVLKETADVYAWAIRHGLDRVAAVAQGLMTAVLVIDPRVSRPARYSAADLTRDTLADFDVPY